MLKWVGYILIIALFIAMITAPSADKFAKFANNKTSAASCKPFIDYRSYKIVVSFFGIGHIKECTGTTGVYNPQTGQTMKTNIALPVYGEEQTYLGLFGKFWKL